MKRTAEIFAERLLALRKKKGLSQTDLANAVNLSRGSISYYETSLRVANAEAIANIARYFDVSADYLLGLSDTRKGRIILVKQKVRSGGNRGG